MSMRLNPKWTERLLQEVEAYLDPLKHAGADRKEIDETISYNPAVQWLICLLAQKNIPFKVVQLGAGVKKVTTNTQICPKCHGTGRC